MSNIAEEIDQCGGIKNYLYDQQNKSLFRFLTCGSVDDGKSTLIGRLLYDSSYIYDDQLSSLLQSSKRSIQNNDQLNFASLVDGLQDECVQGITIDVAYRYFSTKNRKFIIADAPGHEQYTCNMVTAASTSDLAILLVDVRKGIRDQTRRHTFIATLLGIRYLIIAINKMDLINYNQDIFENIKRDYLAFIKCFSLELNVQFVPISALYGDNIIHRSKKISWYHGLTLINILDTIELVNRFYENQFLRFPVQYINYNHLDFRGYSGTVASGELYVGKKIKIFPSGHISMIRRIVTFSGDIERAISGDPITIVLEGELDVRRGDIFLDVNDNISSVKSAQVDVVWMGSENLVHGTVFNVQSAHRRVKAYVKFVHYQVDIDNFSYSTSDHLLLNGIGLVDLVFDDPILLDLYSYSPVTGNMIFIDLYRNITLGAGMVRLPLHGGVFNQSNVYSGFELEFNELVRRYFPHWNVSNLLEKK